MSRASLLAPTLAAAFPVLFLYAHNAGQVHLASAMPVFLVAMGGTALLTLVLRLVARTDAAAGFIGTVWVLLFFFYGHLYQGVRSTGTLGDMVGQHAILVPLAVVVAMLPVLLALRRRNAPRAVMPYVTAALAVLVTLNAVDVAMEEIDGPVAFASVRTVNTSPSSQANFSDLPDIYYIVPDRYPSNETLMREYGFDNSAFLGFLEDSGFYLANESNANYHQTFLSLASSLNLDYLDELSAAAEDSKDESLAHELIEDNLVWRTLKEDHGYRFVHFGSWWEPTATNDNADVRVNKYPHLLGLFELENSFARLLLQTTLLGPFQDVLLRQEYFEQDEAVFERCDALTTTSQSHPNSEAVEQCHRMLHAFAQLQEMPSVQGPKLVFVHLTLPHPPFVFAADGQVVEPPPYYFWDELTEQQSEVLRQSMLDQLAFTNAQLSRTISHLLTASARPPVIILQADEGPWNREYISNAPDEWSAETLRTRHGILNAYHLPGGGDDALYPSISPVNSFRVVFNRYFGASLPLLEDRAFRSAERGTPYRFVEVTDEVAFD